MTDKNKLAEAKDMLRAAGYAVIPAEHIHTVEARREVDIRELTGMSRHPGAMDDILKSLHYELGAALSKYTTLEASETPATMGRSFRIRCYVFAKCVNGADPWEQQLVERLREIQG